MILGIGLPNCATLLCKTLNYFEINKALIPILVLSLNMFDFWEINEMGLASGSLKNGDFCLITVNVESDTLN